MSEITIRRATASDAESLTEIIWAAYAPWIERLPGMPDVSAGVTDEIATHPFWVAISGAGGAILGGIMVNMSGAIPHIANLAVHPEAGGGGVGRKLVKVAEDHASGAGHARIGLTTHREMTPTLAFYERLGWYRAGDDGVRVFMEKDLG